MAKTDITKHFPLRLRHAREDKNMTQTELALHLGISDKTVSAYETGRIMPRIDQVQRLAEVLHKPQSYFYSDSSVLEYILADIEQVKGCMNVIDQRMQLIKMEKE